MALRAWNRFTEDDGNGGIVGTRTCILGVGDLDLAGVQNVMRPHVEHVGAFLRGFAFESVNDDEQATLVAAHILDFRRIAITPEQAIEINTKLGVDLGSLEAYRGSGVCDWTRDLRLLKDSPKTEVEALDAEVLRDLIRKALEDALDLDLLRAVKDEQEEARRLIPALTARLNGLAS